jgi:hypothetical protein
LEAAKLLALQSINKAIKQKRRPTIKDNKVSIYIVLIEIFNGMPLAFDKITLPKYCDTLPGRYLPN